MTDPVTRDCDTIAGFYDAIADDYDAMTGFAGRFDRERPHLARLVALDGIRTAVDAGSGTGLHALLLAELGVEVTAVELSERMARRVADHATERGLRVRVAVGDIRRLEEMALGRVDAVFCLGNTLAHMESPAALDQAARSFARTVNRGGMLVVQMLNYDRILARRETIQSVRQADGVTFVRFYEFGDDRLRFNILRIWTAEGALRYDLQTAPVSPFGRKALQRALEQAGFTDIRCYGAISRETFRAHDSTDLVVLARTAR